MSEYRMSRNAARRTAKALLETDRRLFLEETYGYQTALVRMDPWEASPKNDILLAWQNANDKNKKRDTGNSKQKSRNDGTVKETDHHLHDRRQHHIHPNLATLDPDCQGDIQLTKDHLLTPAANTEHGNLSVLCGADTAAAIATTTATASVAPRDAVDWTAAEETQVRQTMQDFLDKNNPDGDDQLSSSSSPEPVLIFPTGLGGRRRKLIHYVAEQLNVAHWSVGKKSSEKTVAVARRRPASCQSQSYPQQHT